MGRLSWSLVALALRKGLDYENYILVPVRMLYRWVLLLLLLDGIGVSAIPAASEIAACCGSAER